MRRTCLRGLTRKSPRLTRPRNPKPHPREIPGAGGGDADIKTSAAIRAASRVNTTHLARRLFSTKYRWPSGVSSLHPMRSRQSTVPKRASNWRITCWMSLQFSSRGSVGRFRPVKRLSAITAPASAPHTFPVRAMPPQKPVAILGIRSDWTPRLCATACKTLSEQQKPLSKSSAALSAISLDLRFMMQSLIGFFPLCVALDVVGRTNIWSVK